MSLLTALLSEDTTGGGSTSTPLDYADLVMFLDAENGVTGNPDVTQWEDQSPAAINFTIPAGQLAPQFSASTQNGLPGIDFSEFPADSGVIDRKLSSADSAFDNFFTTPGAQSIAFAGRIDDLVNKFSTNNCLISKGFQDTNGWQLHIDTSGSLIFQHKRTDGTVWSLTASGFYSQGDLVLGSMRYTGGNTSSAGFFEIYNGSDFVVTGSISTGTAGGTGQESTSDLIIGNVVDQGTPLQNQPFGGPIFGIWMVVPDNRIFDNSYLARWIP